MGGLPTNAVVLVRRWNALSDHSGGRGAGFELGDETWVPALLMDGYSILHAGRQAQGVLNRFCDPLLEDEAAEEILDHGTGTEITVAEARQKVITCCYPGEWRYGARQVRAYDDELQALGIDEDLIVDLEPVCRHRADA